MRITLTFTAGELDDMSLWPQVCEMKGLGALAIGTDVRSREEVTLDLHEAQELGILSGRISDGLEEWREEIAERRAARRTANLPPGYDRVVHHIDGTRNNDPANLVIMDPKEAGRSPGTKGDCGTTLST